MKFARVDKNQKEIVTALRKVGAKVSTFTRLKIYLIY